MLSIPEIATQLVDKTLSQVDEDNLRTLFLVGSKSVGKSTLLNTFLDKPDAPRETLVLEYSFGRKSNQKHGIEKTLCHIWEYGGKIETLKNVLPSIPIRGNYYFCVMVDLSKVKRIWNTIETCLQAMNDIYSDLKNLPELVVICGKYDLFKNYDTEIKKIVCTTIRSVALLNNANVLFYSCKEPQLVRRVKDVLQNLGFGNNIPTKEKNTNFTKPLIIPKGSDSWESIGTAASTLDQIKARHLLRIPPEAEVGMTAVTPITQQASHPEPVLDSLVALKYDELRNIESLDISVDDYLLSIHK